MDTDPRLCIEACVCHPSPRFHKGDFTLWQQMRGVLSSTPPFPRDARVFPRDCSWTLDFFCFLHIPESLQNFVHNCARISLTNSGEFVFLTLRKLQSAQRHFLTLRKLQGAQNAKVISEPYRSRTMCQFLLKSMVNCIMYGLEDQFLGYFKDSKVYPNMIHANGRPRLTCLRTNLWHFHYLPPHCFLDLTPDQNPSPFQTLQLFVSLFNCMIKTLNLNLSTSVATLSEVIFLRDFHFGAIFVVHSSASKSCKQVIYPVPS